MHYKKNIWGKWVGLATSDNYYLSENGRHDPEAEFFALLEGAEKSPKMVQEKDAHPICRFPFRYSWLKKKLPNLIQAKPSNCEKYDSYWKRHKPANIAVAFSAYNVNSPSSAFGHTLIRITNPKSLKDKNRSELLDYGVNFAASVAEGVNPMWYAIAGMNGGFNGVFSSVPYYYKVREYNDFEARDIWTYNLNLTIEEQSDLVRHLWELGNTKFDYYFLTENCSYFVFRAIQAVAPRYNLLETIPFWVIPGDTVRGMMKVKGLVSSVEYRPSIKSQMDYRLAAMKPEDKELVQAITSMGKEIEVIKNLSQERQRQILDASLDYMELSNPDDLHLEKSPSLKLKYKLLMARASNGLVSSPLKIPAPKVAQPHLGHESARSSISFGNRKNFGKLLKFNLRFALHDSLDSEEGYMRNAGVGFFNLKASYHTEVSRAQIDSLKLIDVQAYPAYSYFQDNLSWKFNMGTERRTTENCVNCSLTGIEMYKGRTWALNNSESLLFYSLIGGELKHAPSYSYNEVLFGLGLNIGGIYHFNHREKLQFNSSYVKHIGAERTEFHSSKIEYRNMLGSNFAIGFSLTKESVYEDSSLQLFHYF